MNLSAFFRIFSVLSMLSTSGIIEAQREISIARLIQAPTIDGLHETAIWDGFEFADSLVQMQPRPGQAATEESKIYIGQTTDRIYISAILYYSDKLVASIQNRDELSESDDCMILLFDSYNDRRTGYGFWINPLGTQADFRINDDGRSMDVNWDTEWESAVGIEEDRWVIEISIPFASIRYDADKTEWGFNVGRLIRSNFEKDYWSGLLSEDFRISQGGILRDIQPPEKNVSLTIFPYAALQAENSEESNDEIRVGPSMGGDMKLQLNSSFRIDGTINPDFATVESDQEQLNLTRYELSYPEKRLFFQEGNEMYDTRIRTFYSRRIEDILYGAKVNGKAGKYNINALNVRTIQGMEDDEPPSFFSTVRMKRDFLESSSLGFTAVDRRGDSMLVTTFSGDYMLNLGQNWKLTGQLVASLPGDFGSHSAWFVRFAHESNIHHLHFRYTELGENFMDALNKTGFITDDNRREMDADFSYRFWINNPFLRYIFLSSKNNIFWSRTNGELRSWYTTQGFIIFLENKFSFEYDYNNEYKLFDESYYNHQHILGIGYNTEEWSQISMDYSFGRNFNRDFNRLKGRLALKLSDKIAVSYTADYIHLSPDTSNSSTLINVLNCQYNLTKDLWIELFGQSRSNIDKYYIYGKLGWRFKPPFGAVYLIYSHDQDILPDGIHDTDALFVKLTLPLGIIK